MWHASGGASWGVVAFWLFIAAVVVAGTWEKSRREAEKHETLRRIIEKTGTVDEARLKELFSRPSTPDWMTPVPGQAYQAMRLTGAIFLAIGAAVAFCFLAMNLGGAIPHVGMVIGLSVAGGLAMMGLGFFFAARFTEPPPDRGNGPAR
jgi:hypothetical protein